MLNILETTSNNSRVIVTSDIHGNLKAFKSLLEQVKLSNNDILVLVGDLIERGESNLDTILYIIKLSKKMKVICLMGNNDDIVLDIINPPKDFTNLKKYLDNRHSIIHDMGYINGSDFYAFGKVASIKYKEVIDFLLSMYHIVKIDNKIFVHAGIEHEDNLYLNDETTTLTKLFFSRDTDIIFKNTIICGHTPCCLYIDDYVDNIPHFNKNKNIISIDGGNMIHSSGQLNMIVFDDIKQLEYQVYFYANALKKIALSKQEKSSDGLHIKYYDNSIIVTEEYKDYIVGIHKTSNKQVVIPRSVIKEQNGNIIKVFELSLYYLEVEIGDTLYLIREDYNGYYCNKNGIIGYYKRDI